MIYLLVEGITDVALIKYISVTYKITQKYNDFIMQGKASARVQTYKHISKNIYIIDIKGQDNLEYTLSNIIKFRYHHLKSL